MSTETHASPKPAPPGAPPPAASQPATAAHGDVIEKLEQAAASSHDANQRATPRRPWVTQITLLISDPLGKPRTLNVASHDISTGGFSFVYKQFLHLNTKVRVQFESLPGRPSIDGIVRSCVHVGGMHHRIGVQFAAPKPAPEEATKPKSSP